MSYLPTGWVWGTCEASGWWLETWVWTVHGQALWEALAQGWVDEVIWEQLIDEVEAQGFVQSQMLWWEVQRPGQVPGPPLCGGGDMGTEGVPASPLPR